MSCVHSVKLSTGDILSGESRSGVFIKEHPADIKDSAVFFCVPGVYAPSEFRSDIMRNCDFIKIRECFFQEVRGVGIRGQFA